MIDRRAFLGSAGAGLAAACAPAAAPLPPAATAPSGAAGWERQWQELSEAAKKEGKVGVYTTSSVGYRKVFEAFEAAFPGIGVEHQQATSSAAMAPKLLEERKAGVYELDVLVASGSDVLSKFLPAQAIDPLRPLLFRPDILDEKAWRNGFEGNWVDDEKKWGFAMEIALTAWAVDTNQVKDGEIQDFNDLLDPKWKGRIIMLDVRSGSTYNQMTGVRLARGEEALRKLIVDQQPFFTRDTRQVVEALVRGTYAISNNANQAELQEFLEAGVGKNVKRVRVKDAMHSSSAGVLWAVNKAPHPKAAQLLMNWLLTKEAQAAYSKFLGRNSLRADVDLYDPLTFPDPGVKYFYSGNLASVPEFEKTQKLLTDWVR